MRTLLAFAMLFLIPFSPPPSAKQCVEDGRIPITGEITITAPGHYFLARDIRRTGGVNLDQPLIEIHADNVVLDLNGHSLLVTKEPESTAETGIGVVGTNVTIRNGTISGANTCLVANSGNLRVENVALLNWDYHGIVATTNHIELISNRVFGPGNAAVIIQGMPGGDITSTAVVTGNTFQPVMDGVQFLGFNGSEIRNNIIRCFDGCPGSAFVFSGAGNIIEGNTVYGNFGFGAVISGVDNTVQDNVVSGTLGSAIQIKGSSNRLVDNQMKTEGDNALDVQGNHNLVLRNQMGSLLGFGIWFETGSEGNSYRDNFLRNNTAGAVGGNVSSQTDDGGNIH